VTNPLRPFRVFAPAKINLFLHVGDKRNDGFHALESLVVFARTGDRISFAHAGELELALEGQFGAALHAEPDNLVLRAARALREKAGIGAGATMRLGKSLPVASGIGGGSADCAAALRGLMKLWDVDLPPQELNALAASLGSDVPVCVGSAPAWMEGRGEKVTPLTAIPDLSMLLVNPRVPVPTGRVFAGLKTRRGIGFEKPRGFSDAASLLGYLRQTSNDLEAPARDVAPEVGQVLDALSACPGVGLARMSGSGATCFALFEKDSDATAAEAALTRAHPHWWVVATSMASTPLGLPEV
jgi:4-diphosphocytidyl-2-C-methyl-D-erythritol kinase